MAVEQLLARTSTAAAAVTVASQAPAAPAAAPPAQEHSAQQQQQPGTPQRKLSRSASFSAFIKGIFSPKSASKAAPQAAHAAVPASPSAARAFGTSNAANLAAAAPASPAVNVPGSGAVGVQAARPASASALPRHVASPSVADRGRYAVLHQRAAARLAQAAAEPAPAATNPQVQQRGDVWRRYEEKITSHRHQLDTTKSQLDEAVRKLRDMQVRVTGHVPSFTAPCCTYPYCCLLRCVVRHHSVWLKATDMLARPVPAAHAGGVRRAAPVPGHGVG